MAAVVRYIYSSYEYDLLQREMALIAQERDRSLERVAELERQLAEVRRPWWKFWSHNATRR